jgi:uncharacterized protein (DUF433 family)
MEFSKSINVCGFHVHRKSLGLLAPLAGHMQCAPTSEKHGDLGLSSDTNKPCKIIFNKVLVGFDSKIAMKNNEIVQNSNTNGKAITKTRGVCGGEACIAGTRIAVWLLVEAQQLGISDAQLLQDYPHITATDLANAWIYANTFPEEIAAVIQVNSDTAVLEQG